MLTTVLGKGVGMIGTDRSCNFGTFVSQALPVLGHSGGKSTTPEKV